MTIIISTNGKLATIPAAGGNLHILPLDYDAYASWSAGPVFTDGHRLLLTSSAQANDWRGEAATLQWVYDLRTGILERLTAAERFADFVLPCFLLPGEEQMVATVMQEDESRLYRMDLDGSHPTALTQRGDGFHYFVFSNPMQDRMAFHVTGRPFSRRGYHVVTSRLDGTDRRIVAEDEGHLYFGPTWSPDGAWLTYLACYPRQDPGHDWADLCMGRPDGSEHRVLTHGSPHWFATSYGRPEHPLQSRSGGSNLPVWLPDGTGIVFACATEGATPPWQWRSDQVDTDHFNRAYRPDQAQGGTYLCKFDIATGSTITITTPEAGRWDAHPRVSPDGTRVAFRRARTGETAAVWIMDIAGQHARKLTDGEQGLGASIAGWIAEDA